MLASLPRREVFVILLAEERLESAVDDLRPMLALRSGCAFGSTKNM
jgi:hypothetical protein